MNNKEIMENFEPKEGILQLPSGTKITSSFVPYGQAVNVATRLLSDQREEFRKMVEGMKIKNTTSEDTIGTQHNITCEAILKELDEQNNTR